ncbi:MAG TPA: hypothetical protein VGL94_01355 [Ktedonobacteraceae bacterium]|jgi:hypothetical protein
MAKSLFTSVVPACTLSTYPEGKRRQTFASALWHVKTGPMYTKR